MITITAHKIHGPLGIGALLIKKRITLETQMCGGGQEDGLRSGTYNLPGAIAFAKAVRIAQTGLDERFEKVSKLAMPLLQFVMEDNDNFEFNSIGETNPYIINFSLKKKKASVVVEALSNMNIMISSISACHSKGEKASYIVLFNLTNDAHESLKIAANTNAKIAKVYDRFTAPDYSEATIEDGVITLDTLEPYNLVLIEI